MPTGSSSLFSSSSFHISCHVGSARAWKFHVACELRLFYILYIMYHCIAVWMCAGRRTSDRSEKKNKFKQQTPHISVSIPLNAWRWDGRRRSMWQSRRVHHVQLAAGGSFCFFLSHFFPTVLHWSQNSIDLNDLFANLWLFFFCRCAACCLYSLSTCAFLLHNSSSSSTLSSIVACSECCVVHYSFDALSRFTATKGEVQAQVTHLRWTLRSNWRFDVSAHRCRCVLHRLNFFFRWIFWYFFSARIESIVAMGKCQCAFQLNTRMLFEKPPHFLHGWNESKTFCIDSYHVAIFTRTPRNINARWFENWM